MKDNETPENREFLTFLRTFDCVCKDMNKEPTNVTLINELSLSCGEIEVIQTLRDYDGKTRSNNDIIESLLNKGILVKNPSCNGTYYTLSPLSKNLVL